MLIQIHGGPESQFCPGFLGRLNYLINELGIVLIMPNVRGSSGYGKTYLKLDNGMLREGAVKDIGALFDWIAQQPDLDKDRVGVSGGWYGGFMSLAVQTTYNNRIKAGIDIVGISNFVTFLKNTQGYRRDLGARQYGDERDPRMRKFLERISPLAARARSVRRSSSSRARMIPAFLSRRPSRSSPPCTGTACPSGMSWARTRATACPEDQPGLSSSRRSALPPPVLAG